MYGEDGAVSLTKMHSEIEGEWVLDPSQHFLAMPPCPMCLVVNKEFGAVLEMGLSAVTGGRT